MKRAVIIGASRGLGAGLVRVACDEGFGVTGFARKAGPMEKMADDLPGFEFHIADLATDDGQSRVTEYLLANESEKVFCVAGGGPYKLFGATEFKNHDWAWEVSFRAHARVLHALAKAGRFPQVILIGSAVAENSGDARAASYAAAKHALRGLHASLRLDYPDWDVRLCSPGYMNTALLPVNAPARKAGVYDPIDVANDVWFWSAGADKGAHKVYAKHPDSGIS